MSSAIQSILTSISTQLTKITGTTIVQEEVFGGADENDLGGLAAVPGLTTFLDVTLFDTYESQLTATITTGHQLLYTLLDMKHQSIKILNLTQKFHDMDECNKINSFHNNNRSGSKQHAHLNHHQPLINTAGTISKYYALEGLARTCLDVSCDSIQRITTDRFADTANLVSSPVDPNSYDTTTMTAMGATSVATMTTNNKSSSNNNNNYGGKNNSSSNNNNNTKNNSTSASMTTLVSTFLESVHDTGRRGTTDGMTTTITSNSGGGGGGGQSSATAVYRSQDCWESTRLFCPDYIWGDDIANYVQRIVRLLLKNPYVASSFNDPNHSNDSGSGTTGESGGSYSNDKSSSNYRNKSLFTFRPVINTMIEQEASLLLLVITRDLPTRLVQFRASIEADAIVMKRLYLVKLEYRAPFRAFLESHQSLQRAPSLSLINEYMHYPKSKIDAQRTECKDNLQQLLMQPYLVEALALENKCEEYEVAMMDTLYGFSELSRYILLKRACIIPPLDDDENEIQCNIVQLRETIRRLRSICCRKGGPDSSTGIRPLLLDLQGVPRDEERYDASIAPSYFVTENDFERRLDVFINQLQTLRKLCLYSKRHCFFRSDKKLELEIPSSIVRGCETFDDELFRCHCIDWFSMIHRQHDIVGLEEHHNFDDIAESIRKAEIQMSLAAATHQSLDVVRLRLETIESDREKRFVVLKEIVEDVCLREMNIRICIDKPTSMDKTLALQPTSALGIFGHALQMADETLPLG